METKVKSEIYVAPSTQEGITSETALTETQMLPPARETNAQLQQISNSISAFLQQLPTLASRFFEAYKLPIISIGLILAAIVTLRVIFAAIDALNDLPLLSPFFELVGISYAAWFINRYLLKAETRQELAAKIQSLKQEIFGES